MYGACFSNVDGRPTATRSQVDIVSMVQYDRRMGFERFRGKMLRYMPSTRGLVSYFNDR